MRKAGPARFLRRRLAAAAVALCAFLAILAAFSMAAAPVLRMGDGAEQSASGVQDAAPAKKNEEDGEADAQMSEETAGAAAPDRDSMDSGGDAPSGNSGDGGPDVTCEEGIVLVHVPDGMDAGDVSRMLSGIGCIQTKSVDDQDIAAGFARIAVSDGTSTEDAVVQLASAGLDAQPNYAYAPADDGESGAGGADLAEELGSPLQGAGRAGAYATEAETNDPLVTASSAGSNYQGMKDTEVGRAWDLVTTNRAVSVAVLDTGLRTTHEDLADNVLATFNATVGNRSNGLDGDVSDVADTNGHGTHVAGIIAAEADNGVGVAGTSYNAGIVAVKVFPAATFTTPSGTEKKAGLCYTDDLACAYDYVVENSEAMHIRVVNMSVSGPSTDEQQDGVLADAVEKAYDHGIVTVCAAGNRAVGHATPYLSTPADLPAHLVAVMNASYSQGTWDRYITSNYNTSAQACGSSNKNICAPGRNILSTLMTGDSKYGEMSGTSMASPWVAGIVAMEFAANSSLSAERAMSCLYETATDLGDEGWDAQTGYGLVDAYRAVRMAEEGSTEAPKDLSAAVVEDIPDQAYTRFPVMPSLFVTYDGNELVKDRDFSVAYADNVDRGTATATITGIGRYTGSKIVTFAIVDIPQTIPVLRLYNRWTGEHLFTTDTSEYGNLEAIGWTQEGIGWEAPATGDEPVYRLYNPYSGDHLYTGDAAEYGSLAGIGWIQEGVAFYSAGPTGTPVYRLYNRWLTAGTHLYTTDAAEYAHLSDLGWFKEGIALYGS